MPMFEMLNESALSSVFGMVMSTSKSEASENALDANLPLYMALAADFSRAYIRHMPDDPNVAVGLSMAIEEDWMRAFLTLLTTTAFETGRAYEVNHGKPADL